MSNPSSHSSALSEQRGRRRIQVSLRTRLLLASLAIALIPLMLMAYLNVRATSQALTEAANIKLYAAASQTASSIDDFIAERLTSIQTEARLPDLVEYLSLPEDRRRGSDQETRARTILFTLSGKEPFISSYALLDRRGLTVLDTFLPDVDLNKFTSDYFMVPMQTGQSYVSPIRFSATTGEQALYFSSPVENAAGELVGVLSVRYNADALLKLIAQSTGLAGEGSFAILLDQDHIRLADGAQRQMAFKSVVPLDPTRLATLKADGRLPERAPEELATNLPDFEQGLAQADAQPFFVAELHSAGEGLKQCAVAKTKKHSWWVVFAQPRQVFLAPIAGQARNALILAIGIAIVVAVGAIGTAQLLLRPILHLTHVAQLITQGDLTAQAPVQSHDEIGVLATAFNTMTAQLRDMISSLELRVEARTAQLRASTEVGRAASTILDPQELLQRIVDLICERFGFYYAGVFLLDRDRRFAVLRAGRGEAGRVMLESGHKLEIGGQSMVGWVCANKQARVALDVGQDAVRFANPLLPDTRSEIALPLRIGDRILGALDVQSVQEAAFDESSIAVLQGMADQIAIALENARLFAETQTALAENRQLVAQAQASLQETAALYEASRAISTASDTDAIFQAIVERSLRPEIDLCLLVLFEPYEGQQPEYAQISHAWTREPTTSQTLQIRTRTAWADFPLRDLLTAEPSVKILSHDVDHLLLREYLPPDLQSIAFVPLIAGSKWIGALGLGTSGQTALTTEWLKPYQSLAAQAAVSIENRRLIESTQASLQELNALYRQVTREAWQRALQSRPALAEYDYAPAGPAASDGSKLEMPLTLRGQEIGVVELTRADRPAWSEQERALVEAVVTQAALALDSARLFDETQRLAGRERLINEITARIRATSSVPAILQTAARELAQALDVPHAVARIQIKDEG